VDHTGSEELPKDWLSRENFFPAQPGNASGLAGKKVCAVVTAGFEFHLRPVAKSY
jgi:hypothetical protein